MSKKSQMTLENFDEKVIRDSVSNDLGCAVALINMIRNDPEMLKAIQDIIIGRIKTDLENKALEPELEGING